MTIHESRFPPSWWGRHAFNRLEILCPIHIPTPAPTIAPTKPHVRIAAEKIAKGMRACGFETASNSACETSSVPTPSEDATPSATSVTADMAAKSGNPCNFDVSAMTTARRHPSDNASVAKKTPSQPSLPATSGDSQTAPADARSKYEVYRPIYSISLGVELFSKSWSLLISFGGSWLVPRGNRSRSGLHGCGSVSANLVCA